MDIFCMSGSWVVSNERDKTRSNNENKIRPEVPESARGWCNIKMSSYQYRKSHCGDKTILRPSYLHNRISCTGKMSSLYWIRAQYSICLLGGPGEAQGNIAQGRVCGRDGLNVSSYINGNVHNSTASIYSFGTKSEQATPPSGRWIWRID